ncbi:POP1-domain-containing protein [Dentipellis sp. KUC8613]|nr:POP1-domain-containing protein [Dentipellis sp. KUC8613]
MPPKRPNEQAAEEMSSRERKKQKMSAARTIAVQETSGTGSTAGNAVAGPSKTVRIDSMKGLPTSLDVEKFTEARAFEINAMHNAMKSASSSSTHRAWQELPRHLRRRAASHDVRRVPARLRQKAKAEMDPMRKKILGRKPPRKSKHERERKADVFAKRQIDKKWLESHLWHAKRMHMENMWGYRLAVQPTEKSFRPSYRAAVHGAILHDASYYSLMQVTGPEHVLKRLLESCCDPQGPGPSSKRYTDGVRACDITMYRPNLYPFTLIGPVTLMWRPVDPLLDTDKGQADTNAGSSNNGGKKKKKGKKKSSDAATTSTQPQPTRDDISRTIWIRCHPTIFKDAYLALKIATSTTLEELKKSSDHLDKKYEVELANLSDSVNVFEIMGPKSSQVIRGALTPDFNNETRKEFKKVWSALSNLQSTGSLPGSMIIGFNVLDPRLNFPPKNAKVNLESQDLPSLPAAWNCLPSSDLAKSGVWDDRIRQLLKVPKYKKHEIDARRAQNPIPGTPLKPNKSDNRVPVMLVQRSVPSDSNMSRPTTSPSMRNNDTPIHGWTLIVPKGWSMPFLTSLVYTGTRVGGQRERQHQAFEAGQPYFPRDFPFTAAYDDYTTSRAHADEERWLRKPPAKRPNWEKLETPSPWKPDWRVVLGLPSLPTPTTDEDPSSNMTSTQRDAVPEPDDRTRPWLLCGPETHSILDTISNLFNPGPALLERVNKLRFKRDMGPLAPEYTADMIFQGALVQVRVVPVGRGHPEDFAVIYSLDDEEAKRWKVAVEHRKRTAGAIPEDTPSETEMSKVPHVKEKAIGYATSANYSLALGEGHALGAIPVAKYLQLQQQAGRLSLGGPLVKIRNRDDTVCRAAYVNVI